MGIANSNDMTNLRGWWDALLTLEVADAQEQLLRDQVALACTCTEDNCHNDILSHSDTLDYVLHSKNLKELFKDCDRDQLSLKTWDTSKITNMDEMFVRSSIEIAGIENWDTSSVTSMRGMFMGARSFNEPLKWDTQHVTDMSLMFHDARDFNQHLDFSNTHNVVNMSYMFTSAVSYNHMDLADFDTSNVRDMQHMFHGATQFNPTLLHLETSNVRDFSSMFEDAHSFNGAICRWDTSNAKSMSKMFKNARIFNGDIHCQDAWNTMLVEDMEQMFAFAKHFNQPLEHFDVSNAWNLKNMFTGADSFQSDISNWSICKDDDSNTVRALLMSGTKNEMPDAFLPTFGAACDITCSEYSVDPRCCNGFDFDTYECFRTSKYDQYNRGV